MAPLQYTLDVENRITWVNREWDLFADQNGSPEVMSDYILGTSIFTHIVDQPTRTLYQDLFFRLRSGNRRKMGRGLEFLFRCDSPDCLRSMVMNIEVLDNSVLRISTECVYTEPIAPPCPKVYACEKAPLSLPRCSVCGRVHWRGHMQDPEQALRRGMPLDFGGCMQVHYIVCSDCGEAIQSRMQKVMNKS